MQNMLDKIGKQDLLEFVNLCSTLFGMCPDAFIEETPNKIKQIQDKWYVSLKSTPDYTVYDDVYYLADCFACWKLYSRTYLRSIISRKSLSSKDGHLKSIVEDMGKIHTVVDVGCGIGYTTLALQEIFPNAKVYGTNLKKTKQWELCKYLGVNLVDDIKKVKNVDLIVAFEYFEHFEDPISHLKYLIQTSHPKYLIIANSFGTISVGHFINQVYHNKTVPAKGFGRIFNKELRMLGYKKQCTMIFNSKPSYWVKQSDNIPDGLFNDV